jgi:hypothetical protein
MSLVVALTPALAGPQHQQTLGMVILFVYYGGSFAVQALIQPVYGIALVLFYYDQRIRLEGFDIEWMMQRAGLVAPAMEPAMEAEPNPHGIVETAQPAFAAEARVSAQPEPAAPFEGTNGEPQ